MGSTVDVSDAVMGETERSPIRKEHIGKPHLNNSEHGHRPNVGGGKGALGKQNGTPIATLISCPKKAELSKSELGMAFCINMTA